MSVHADKLALLGEIAEASYELQRGRGAHHDPGTGQPADEVLAEWQHRELAELEAAGGATWKDELRDVTAAVYAGHDWAELRPALIATATLVLCWLLDGDQPATYTYCPAGKHPIPVGAVCRRCADTVSMLDRCRLPEGHMGPCEPLWGKR